MDEIRDNIFNYLFEFAFDGKATFKEIYRNIYIPMSENEAKSILNDMITDGIVFYSNGYYEV